ncbi:MAG: MATE family efflux transporter, partial [Peptococcaceae bacterium]|nr:MATE family efflux transporter [Peptococcaceae bacterium]
PTAYISAVSAFVAQNTGAGQYARARQTLWVGMMTAAVIGGAMAYLSFFHGDALSRLFIGDVAVIAASAEFLKATALECFILSMAYCYDGYFNGIEKTTFVMVQGIIAALFVRIPYAYYASIQPTPSLFNIGLSTALAAAFMFVVCSGYYAWHRKHT